MRKKSSLEKTVEEIADETADLHEIEGEAEEEIHQEPSGAPPAPPKVFAPGLYPDVPFDEYAAAPGLSVSRLKLFAEAPAKARFGEFRETPSMLAGTLLHTTMLEPHAVEERYVGTSLARRGTKLWKAEEEAAKVLGKRLVKQEELDVALRQRDALLQHPIASQILTPEMAVEQSMWWTDPETGLLLRGRADGVRRDLRVLVDVKTAESGSLVGFTKAVRRFHYDWQDAHYRNGMLETEGWYPDSFIFVVVESAFPHLVACYELNDAAIHKGNDTVAGLLRDWKRCVDMESGGVPAHEAWPGYDTTLTTINLEDRHE